MKRLALVILVLTNGSVMGQNLENLGKGKLLRISGGVNTSSVFYAASGMSQRRDPFNYFINGNLNISVYDWSVPLSFSYSNQNRSFHQPFNRYGLSPTYKWITIHAGYRSMSFSNYSVNGHAFLGGGADLTCSQLIRVSIFYGRLQKASGGDTTQTSSAAAYRRMGGGAKISIGRNSKSLDVIFFKAKDDVSSINDLSGVDVNPQENVVFNLSGSFAVTEKLSFRGEYASSAMSSDIRSEALKVKNLWSTAGNVFESKTSSSFYNAMKASMQYALASTGIGLVYEKIDPGYRTLGAYYFNNNLETYAFTISTVMFDKQVRLNGQLGTQRNNLDRTELNTMRRISSSIGFNYQPSKRTSYQASYSNFQTVVNFRSQFEVLNQSSPYENVDTLRYRQLSSNATASANFVVNDTKERKQNLSVNISLQQSAQQQPGSSQPGSRFYNVNSNYSLAVPRLNMSLVFSANGNVTEVASGTNKIFGPSVSGRTSFLNKKLNINSSISYNENYLASQRIARVFNARASLNYILKEKHGFDLGITRVSRSSIKAGINQSFSEVTGQVSYSYSFATK